MADDKSSSSDRDEPDSTDRGVPKRLPLAADLGALARELDVLENPHLVLAAIVAAAVDLVPGADAGSVSVVLGRRRVRSEAPTGDLPRHIDALQEETEQGPCLDSAFEHQTTRVEDMATETRWPVFAPRAVEAGAASMLCLQLWAEKDTLGALNLISRTPHAFTDESERTGLLFAAHAAIAYAAARTKRQLQDALASRDLIGQAKGILMERYSINAQRAFMVLVRVSQNSNRKLTEVAAELVTDGSIAAAATGPSAPESG